MTPPVDRTRRFSLPGIHELNKDQDAACALPLEGQHVIVGGPGTGKSVVALLRARKLLQAQKQYRVLVYNHLLEGSNRQLFGTEQPLRSLTWETWFRKIYKHFFKSPVPTSQAAESGRYQGIDWEAVADQVQQYTVEKTFTEDHFLLIDEGQDMPPAFYRTLANLSLQNFYVVADQNQQIFPDKCSSRQEIENELSVAPDDTLELRTNHRNTRPIAFLAQHFYPGDPASPLPEAPAERPGALVPELWCYGTAAAPSLTEITTRILKLSDRNPRKLIGILTPDNRVREKYLHELRRLDPGLDNGRPPVQTYDSSDRTKLDFGQGGIMVINAQSCKGLEFDTAILADIDQHQPKDVKTLKSRFYVMVARGREQVLLLRSGAPCPVIDSLLPADSNVLSRK